MAGWTLAPYLRGQWQNLLSLITRRQTALILIVTSIVLVSTTFIVLAGGMSITHRPEIEGMIFLLDIIVLAFLTMTIVSRLRKMLSERRTGLAGARLHVRLIALFGVVSVAPAVVIGTIAALFFHFGVQIWFSNRVNLALSEARDVAAGYLQEHNENIRTEAFAMANQLIIAENDDMLRHGPYAPLNSGESGHYELDFLHNAAQLASMLDFEATERGLTEAVVYDAYTDKVVASGGLAALQGRTFKLPPRETTSLARSSDAAILDAPDEKTVRAVVSLGSTTGLMLAITRPVDAKILEHMRRTNAVVSEYQRLNANRSAIQISFVLIFALLSLLVLTVGMLTGLVLANQIARPLGLLIIAARRVSLGDLSVRVPEGRRSRDPSRDDEVGILSRAFNRMTDQVSAQRTALIEANEQINERRRFTESVLEGVSAGVIGLDARQVIELPNKAASTLLQRDIDGFIGRHLQECVPEFSEILDAVRDTPGQVRHAEIQIDTQGGEEVLGDGPRVGARGRTLLVRVAREQKGADVAGYVVTFDDITALQSAERKAAWADVARRIAHEIKNPLTPIQLSAERLKRRFMKEISSDTETFGLCVDTIVRHVGDIGRMVDEFSAFARMPAPELKEADLGRLLREAIVLQKNAHPEIAFETSGLTAKGPMVTCDRRLIGQALTNLLQNAADAITMSSQDRKAADMGAETVDSLRKGEINVALRVEPAHVDIMISDDGTGLPETDRHRLTEPYITHKPKGTGLGLAIVKKIMDDHHGTISLEDRGDKQGTIAILTLPRHNVLGQG